MIFDWMENDSIDRVSQILNIIYDLKMVTKDQLRAVTGLKPANLEWHLKAIKKKECEDPSDWLQSVGLRDKNVMPCKNIYFLGKRGIQYVQQQRFQEVRVREAPIAQRFHNVGLNSILYRAITKIGKEYIAWYTEGEQADILYLDLKKIENVEPDRRSIIRPDARIRIGKNIAGRFEGVEWYVEYDNDTEGPKQLEIKFHRYFELLQRLGTNTPILWVTTNEKRKEYLKKNWDATMRFSYDGQKQPQSLFLVEGEEVELFENVKKGLSRAPSLMGK